MLTSTNWNIFHVTGLLCLESVNSPHKCQWHRALMFLLSAPWMNGWVNNREAGDLRCHLTHYDVIVMLCKNYVSPVIQQWIYHSQAWSHLCSDIFLIFVVYSCQDNPDSKVHGANMGSTWVLSAQMGPMLAPWTLLLGKLPNGLYEITKPH